MFGMSVGVMGSWAKVRCTGRIMPIQDLSEENVQNPRTMLHSPI